jgi:hypothetical protein
MVENLKKGIRGLFVGADPLEHLPAGEGFMPMGSFPKRKWSEAG